MLFEGVLGIAGGSLGLLDVAEGADVDCRDSGRRGLAAAAWVVARVATSDLIPGRGGGYGDMETEVTVAECAW